jgi:hypothetical protein
MNHEDIIKRLLEPFTGQEIEWKIQVTTQDKSRGMAVAYMDARAVQKRLDEVVGPFNWKNVYSLWHDNSQICGISIFNADRNEWITKFDGAENSDIEPIKGGLSDSFKRAATVWGIGRYLYEMEGIWVEIEAKGKSCAIKQNQYAKLEAEYNAVVSRIFGSKPTSQGAPTGAANKQAPNTPPSNITNIGQPAEQPSDKPANDFKVQSVKPSGKSSQVLELIDGGGKKITAFIRASDSSIVAGSRLRKVQMERKNSDYGAYNLITKYEAA